MLDIYVVSLSASWINDATLTSLMGRVPARCILLLEDLDAGKSGTGGIYALFSQPPSLHEVHLS
jgi:hypothetical protein